MLGNDERIQEGMFSYVALEDRIPGTHPLRKVRKMTDLVLASMSAEFDAMYSAHTTHESSIAEWGQWEGMASIATGVAALVSGVIIQALGYFWLFSLMAVASFGLGIYIWLLPRELL